MLTWLGFFGKLIDFTVTKLLGKKIDLSLDEKKRAAKAFLRFHDSVLELEIILGKFIAFVESIIAGRNSRIYGSKLETAIEGLERASSEFIKNMESLGQVLYFYDDQLATLFAHVYIGKAGMVRNLYAYLSSSSYLEAVRKGIVSDSLDYESERSRIFGDLPPAKFSVIHQQGLSAISYTIPDDDLIDFLSGKKVIENEELLRDFDCVQNWGMSLIKDKISEDYIDPENKEKLIELHPILKSHMETLSDAREKLREFIKDHFSLEDLLYVAK